MQMTLRPLIPYPATLINVIRLEFVIFYSMHKYLAVNNTEIPTKKFIFWCLSHCISSSSGLLDKNIPLAHYFELQKQYQEITEGYSR